MVVTPAHFSFNASLGFTQHSRSTISTFQNIICLQIYRLSLQVVTGVKLVHEVQSRDLKIKMELISNLTSFSWPLLWHLILLFLQLSLETTITMKVLATLTKSFLCPLLWTPFLVLQLSLETTIDYHQAFTSLGLQNKQGRKSKCGIWKTLS